MRNTSRSVLLTQSRFCVPVHEHVARRAGQQDQLGRREAHEHLRQPSSAPSFLPGTAALASFQFSSAGSFVKLSGSLPGRRPRALQVGGLQPRAVVQQVERLGRLVLEEVPVRVDGVLQVVLLDRAPDRVAVDVDEHGRRLAEEDRRRIGLHALDVLREDLALVDVRPAPGRARSRVPPSGTALTIFGDDLPHLVLAERREVRLRERHVGEADQARRRPPPWCRPRS